MLLLYKGKSLGQALCTDLVSRDDGGKQMMREIRVIRENNKE